MSNKLLNIAAFIIWDVIFPASEKDADPFKGQGTHGGMMALAAFALKLIKSFGPSATWNGMSGELMERLPEKSRRRPNY